MLSENLALFLVPTVFLNTVYYLDKIVHLMTTVPQFKIQIRKEVLKPHCI